MSPSVGIACLNNSTGQAILSQINDTQFFMSTISTLHAHTPSKVLIPSMSCLPGSRSSLFGSLKTNFPGIPIEPLDRRYWSEGDGLDFVQALAFKEHVEAIKFAIIGKFYATSAFSAVRVPLSNPVHRR